ncbi:MupA/Atu3671 family FMN-dependent luciferase-like monooxygenase [Streptomyces sp. IBSBF 2806]|uniref:MupA/Atu3671 family FMN-dependent luciferase-like monooxygenase n=1 Tax=Streptomyces sp. IBSBF 2806 TaxID=2903529 RepID=UPI002FDBF626
MTAPTSLGAAIDRDLAAMTELARRIDSRLGIPGDPEPGPSPAPGAPPTVHGPRVTVPRGSGMAGGSASPRQRAHLDDLVRRYTSRTRRSKELAARHRRVLADSRSVVGFRSSTKEMLYPIAANRASGAHLEDVDGNRYVDITMGFGVLLFGHEPTFVTEAVQRHLARGIRLGPRAEETGEAAELLAGLTGMERVAFANSGTEANSGALRLARAATGRDLVVTFHGSYHGHADNVLGRGAPAPGGGPTVPVSPGIPRSAVADLLVLDYGTEQALATIEEHADRIAAVVLEPVQSRHPALRPVAFVRRLRELTRRHGIVLMFDEMLTGFRPALRGAQELFGVTPDLATYGKLLGGGYPIGAIAGRADIMDGVDGGFWEYGDDSYPRTDTTFFGGTYIQHPVSMTAARAVLAHLKEQGPGLQKRLNARTDRFATELNGFFTDEEFPLRLAHFGSMFRFEHQADMELLYHHLMLRGVHVWEWRNFFLSTAHTDEDLTVVTDAVKGSLRELRDAGFFTAPKPRPRPEPHPERLSSPASLAAPAAPEPHPERLAAPVAPAAPVLTGAGGATPDFSLYFFGDYPETSSPQDGFELLLEAARFADARGFHAVWSPERHFHSFGGLFPNPVVLAAALARETSRIRINAGSVVLPLHDSIRVAEEWSMADNLSRGRVGIGVASGWHAGDFVFFPGRYDRRRETTYEQVEEVRRLWRGEALTRGSGDGQREVRLFPRPVQPAVPMYAAVVGNPESYELAARHDLGIVTNLMAQSVEQLAENIARYRKVRAEHGLDPAAGRVAVLLHTYLADDHATARAEAYEPLARYMRSSLSLFAGVADSLGHRVDPDSLGPDDLDVLLRRGYRRYCDQRALIGTPASVAPVVDAVVAAGADEIVSLVDFGLSADRLRAGLDRLDELRASYGRRAAAPSAGAPLSAARRAVCFVERMFPGGRLYNEIKAVRLDGPLDVSALRAALHGLVARHEALRTVFRDVDGEPRQFVLPAAVPDFAVVEGPVEEALRTEGARDFDLAEGPLFAARLVRSGRDEHVLVLVMHHIVVDAGSAAVIARDLSVLYRAARTAEPARLPELAPGHGAGAAEPVDHEADLAYWRKTLDGELPVLALPADRPRPATMTGRGRSLFRVLGPELSSELRELSRRHRVTLFMTLLAGYASALHRATGQDELVVGTPVSDRPAGAEDLVGFFVNTVALRLDLSGAPSFTELLRRVRGTALDAYDHAAVPFETVVRVVNPARCTDRTPVYQALAEFETGDPFRLDLPDVRAVPLETGSDRALTDLAVYFTDGPDGVRVRLEYSTHLFDEATVEAFFASLREILTAAVREAGPPPGTRPQDREDTTVHALVARRAAAHPERTAVADGATVLSYGELDLRAGRLGAVLRAHEADGPVAVLLPRSAELVVAQLGVLKSGRAYVPLDPALGSAHTRRILADCGARLLVTSDALREPAGPLTGLTVIDVAEAGDAGPVPPVHEQPSDSPDDPCYVVYTSGTSGSPNGVVVTHRNLLNLCRWHHRFLGVSGEDRSALVCSPAFDAAVLEIWPALTAGAALAVADEASRLDPPALARWYSAAGVTFSILPTPLGEAVLQLDPARQPALRQLLIGGDVMRRRPRPGTPYRVFNVYGPTEGTVLATVAEVAPAPPGADAGPVPIGRPIDGVRLRVLDAGGGPVSTGSVGELYLAGAGVAQGYLGRPEETARRFLPDPDDPTGAGRLYRTGDLVREQADGVLEFHGRVDDQVKIRGFRVEPEEVSRALLALPGVRDAVVTARRDSRGDAFLAAYVVLSGPATGPDGDERAAADRLCAALAERVPDHLVPRAWSFPAALPVTGNGKLDRAALPPPDLVASPAAADVSLPARASDVRSVPVPEPEETGIGSTELRVRLIWSAEFDVGADEIGPDTSFFELGGHSITAIRLLNRVREAFDTDYPMACFYRAPTVRAMVARLAGGGDDGIVAGAEAPPGDRAETGEGAGTGHVGWTGEEGGTEARAHARVAGSL